jgi:hypothetical protein
MTPSYRGESSDDRVRQPLPAWLYSAGARLPLFREDDMTRRALRGATVLSAVVAVGAFAGCGGSSGGGGTALVCGEGTEADGGECVSIAVTYDAAAGCGAGTMLSGGVCIVITLDATATTCGPGTTRSGSGQCVPAPDAGATCGAGTQLVSGVCVPIGQEASTTCGPGTVDDGGVCVPVATDAGSPCGAGTHACGAACFADDDGTHCGASCATCSGSTPACVSGACACTYGSCPTGQACVSGACVAATCTGPSNCTNGMCCSGTCMPGAECCVATDCAAVNACQTAVACTAGQCVYTNKTDGTACGAGSACCGGTCDDLQSDKFNCGACGAACYGGAVTASCFSGHCGQLVAQADNSGTAAGAYTGYPGDLGAPTLAIDANNVYFLAPSDGQVLQSPLSTPGNTTPKVIVTQNVGGPLQTVSMLTVDSTSVYYATALPSGNVTAGQIVASAVPIGGGTVTNFKSGVTNPIGNQSIAVDGTNLYMGLYQAIGVAPKTGGTMAALAGAVISGTNLESSLAADGTYVYYPLCASTCELARYTVSNGNIAYLATGFGETTVVSVGGGNAFWATSSSIMTAPTTGATPPATWETLNPWIGYMSTDPTTGDIYWTNSNGPGGGWGTLYKATKSGQPPVTIMPGSGPGNVWGTPVFDGNGNVYYMMGYPGSVQVWRSPK